MKVTKALQEVMKMNKKEIMTRAHQIARNMPVTLNYRVRLSAGLRQAWAEVKAQATPQTVLYAVNHQPSGGKEWVALITGRHPKFKLGRKFLAPVRRDWSYSGKTGRTIFELEEGQVYEVNVPWKGRKFITVQSGKVVEITAEEVLKVVA